LAKVADPVFIGYCASKSTDCGVKVVGKVAPEEPVGVVCLRNDNYGVVEYSEISEELSKRRNVDGSLAFGAANIANHFFSTDFLDKVAGLADNLEFHIAKKKIPHTDIQTGDIMAPKTPNGMKLECFVFDVFAYAKNMSVLQVNREDEFSPLKNAPGSGVDCPETSRRDIMAQHIRFIEAAGGKISSDECKTNAVLEISPLVSYAGEGLADFVRGKTIKTPAVIETKNELIRSLL
jgi:UDP-N-acetylglucosamine pyrophosphorylase